MSLGTVSGQEQLRDRHSTPPNNLTRSKSFSRLPTQKHEQHVPIKTDSPHNAAGVLFIGLANPESYNTNVAMPNGLSIDFPPELHSKICSFLSI